MAEKHYDWDEIAANPKFRELTRRKRVFLFGWWVFAGLFYFSLPFGSQYAPGIFQAKIIGSVNGYYVFALLQFVASWGIALYYAYVANKDFDRLNKELVDELT